MKKISRSQWRRYINSIRLSPCMTLALGITFIFTAVCVGQTETTSTVYETPGILDAHKILPPDLLEGKNYWVERRVETHRFNNHFTIKSRFGQFKAFDEAMLRIRIKEVAAIGMLEEVKKSSAFAEAAKKAATSPIKGAKALITDPVDTVKGIPKGVGRFFSRLGEMTKGGRGDQEEGYTKELIGFAAVKRQYAYKMGVDVYSSNKVLQKELNSVSWAGFAGGVGVSLAMMPIKGASEAAYFSIMGTKLIHSMNQILLDNSPEDLRRINREKLKQIGIEDSVIEEFLRHPAYSPRHETIISHALAEMDGVRNRDQFIKQALFAEYEEDAFLFQRIAELMHGYHAYVKPIREIIPVRSIVAGYTADQAIAVTIPIDYVYWTERADHGSEALVRLKTADRTVSRVELWITGKLTPKARRELEGRGIVVKEQIREILMPPAAQ